MATDDTKYSPQDNAGPALMVISSLLLALIIITTSLRLYTRYSLRMLGWDDYTITVTAALAVVRVAIQAVQVRHGNGRHRPFLSEEDYIYNNMLGWYAQILLFISTALLKISICLLLLRIRSSRHLKIFLGCVMAGLVVTNLTCVIILLAECTPVSAYWMGGGKCWDTRVRIYAIYITIGKSVNRCAGQLDGIFEGASINKPSSRIFPHDRPHVLTIAPPCYLECPDAN